MSTEARPRGLRFLPAFSLLAAHQPSRTPVVPLSGARHCACAVSTPTRRRPRPLSFSRPFLLFGAHVTWPRRGLATPACVCRVQLVGAQARTDAPSTALEQGKTTEDAADAARSLWPGNDPCDTLRAGPMRVEGPLVVLGPSIWSGGALLRMWSEEDATPANGRSGPGKADHPSLRVDELTVGCGVTFTVCSDRSQVRRPIV